MGDGGDAVSLLDAHGIHQRSRPDKENIPENTLFQLGQNVGCQHHGTASAAGSAGMLVSACGIGGIDQQPAVAVDAVDGESRRRTEIS